MDLRPLYPRKRTLIIHWHFNNLLQKFLRRLSLWRKATPIPPFAFFGQTSVGIFNSHQDKARIGITGKP